MAIEFLTKSLSLKLENLELLMKKFEKLAEDLEFARRTEEAWQEIDEGKFKEMPSEEFLEEIKNLK